jgi:hypothetical protein
MRFLAIAGRPDLQAFVPQRALEHFQQPGIIIYNQNRGHSFSRAVYRIFTSSLPYATILFLTVKRL